MVQRVEEIAATRDALLKDAAERGRAYLDRIAERAVAPDPAAVAALDAFDGDLRDEGADAFAVLEQLDAIGSPATVATTGPRYFGFVTGGTLPVAAAASWLATAWDQNAALAVMSPVAARLDELALRWVAEALFLPRGMGGAFVTGATMANATALAAARDAVLARAGWDAHRDGLVGAPPITVWVGGEAHTTVTKALGFIGLGRSRARVLPSDGEGRIVAGDLPELDDRLPPGGQREQWCERSVRAADRVGAPPGRVGARRRRVRPLGGCESAPKHLVAGVEAADSWAVDAHKWLNVTYDSGIAFVRDPEHLRAAVRADAPYFVDGDLREAMHSTPQSSQRARGVEVWAVLATLGRTGLAEMIDRNCRLARRLAWALVEAGCEVLNDVCLNQVVVALGPATDEILAAVQRDGTCWVGPTTWQGKHAMRVSISNWSTTEADIDRSAAAILRARDAAG